jgi:hypothetical protein
MRFLDFSNKLPVKPWIRMDFFQFSQGLPGPLKLSKLLATSSAAQEVTSNLFLLTRFKFPILVGWKFLLDAMAFHHEFQSKMCASYLIKQLSSQKPAVIFHNFFYQFSPSKK